MLLFLHTSLVTLIIVGKVSDNQVIFTINIIKAKNKNDE